MSQEELKLGDLIDDYCSRCQLLMNHYVVSIDYIPATGAAPIHTEVKHELYSKYTGKPEQEIADARHGDVADVDGKRSGNGLHEMPAPAVRLLVTHEVPLPMSKSPSLGTVVSSDNEVGPPPPPVPRAATRVQSAEERDGRVRLPSVFEVYESPLIVTRSSLL